VQNCVDGLLTITPYTAVGATDCAGLRLGCDGKSLDIKRVTGRCVDSDPCSTQPALDGQSIRTAWTQAASSSSCTSSTVCIAVQTRECGVWGAPAVKCAGWSDQNCATAPIFFPTEQRVEPGGYRLFRLETAGAERHEWCLMQFRETGRFTGYVADVANWTDVLEQGCLPDPEHVPCTDEALYRFRPSIEDWYTTSNSQEYSCDDFNYNSLPWAPHLFCSDLLSEGAQLALALAVRGAKKSTANDLASLLENCPASCGYCLASNSDARELAAEGSLLSSCRISTE
jgi:hypothetical protein